MKTGSILDADMATVGAWLRTGWRWWTGELAALVPARQRVRGGGTARGIVAWYEAGRPLVTTRNGEAMLLSGVAAPLTVSADAVLARTIPIPALGDRDARQMVTLQFDRLMPFPPGAALFDLALAPARDGTRDATIAALPIATADAAFDAAQAAGIAVTALRVAQPDDSLAFDFLPAYRTARDLPDAGAARRWWWRVAAALFVLNVALLIGADMLALRHQEDLVQAHADSASMVRMARRRVIAEAEWRGRALRRRQADDPAALLGRISRDLLAAAWLQRLTLDGGEVRIAGLRHDADVLGALRADRHFRNVRSSSGEMLTSTPEGQPFDITLDLAGGAR